MLQMEISKCWKIVEFQKISIKIKIVKHFRRPKQRAVLRRLFRLLPTYYQIKYYVFAKKVFLWIYTQTWRHLLSTYFKNEDLACQEMVQCKCFFWSQTETCLLEILHSQKSFWLSCGSILFSISIELRFLKWMRFSERTCVVKWVTSFAIFY